MKAVFFGAGLGDFIRTCYNTTRYALISETTELLTIVTATHNPFVSECFAHHPNKAFLRHIDLPGQYDRVVATGLRGPELHNELCRIAGVAPADVVNTPARYAPTFYAADEVNSADHILLQPFAGSAKRNIPMPILRQLVDACTAFGREVHIVTRSYTRKGQSSDIHDLEVIPPDILLNPMVVWHKNLSVPATLNLVKSCALFVGCHSSLLQAAWFEGKPVHVLYPPSFPEWSAERIGTGYTFGANLPGTTHQAFDCFDLSLLQTQLETLLTGDGANASEIAGAEEDPEEDIDSARDAVLASKIAQQRKFKIVKNDGSSVPIVLLPEGWISGGGHPNLARWAMREGELVLGNASLTEGTAFAKIPGGFQGSIGDTNIEVHPDTSRRRYLVCGLQRSCTNLFEFHFRRQIDAPRVTMFYGRAYWKHGYLPPTEQLDDIFVISCVRHPLHWLVACYDYFKREHGQDMSLCTHFSPEWTFADFLNNKHYNWPSPAERWNVMNRHWRERVEELGVNAVTVRAEDCQTDTLQSATLFRVVMQYDPWLPSNSYYGAVEQRLTNTNSESGLQMDPTPYLNSTFLSRYTPELLTKTIRMLDRTLVKKLGYSI